MSKKEKPQIINNIGQLNLEIDYDKLAEAIVKAEEEHRQKQAEQERQDKIEFQKKIGVKDYSNEKNKFKRYFKTLGNHIYIFFRTLFINKEYVKDTHPIQTFVQHLSCLVIGFVQFALYFSAMVFFAFLFWHPGVESFSVLVYILLPVLSMGSFIFAQIFRMIKIEISNMKNREYILAIFSAILTLIPLITAAINFLLKRK